MTHLVQVRRNLRQGSMPACAFRQSESLAPPLKNPHCPSQLAAVLRKQSVLQTEPKFSWHRSSARCRSAASRSPSGDTHSSPPKVPELASKLLESATSTAFASSMVQATQSAMLVPARAGSTGLIHRAGARASALATETPFSFDVTGLCFKKRKNPAFGPFASQFWETWPHEAFRPIRGVEWRVQRIGSEQPGSAAESAGVAEPGSGP